MVPAAIFGLGKDWLAQCLDNMTEWNMRLWCWRPVKQPVEQHYKVTMSAHYHKLVSVLIWL